MDQPNQSLQVAGKTEGTHVAPYSFSFRKCLYESWDKIYGFKWTCWSAAILIFLINLFISILSVITVYVITGSIDNTLPDVAFYSNIMNGIILLIVYPLNYAIFYLGIRRSALLPVKTGMIFHLYRSYIGLIVASIPALILFSIAVSGFAAAGMSYTGSIGVQLGTEEYNTVITIVGLILGIAAFYIAFGFSFAPYLVAEKKMGPFKALALSFNGFKHHGIKIIISMMIASLIVVISAIPLGIGLIWTLPLISVFFGVIYRTIFGVSEV